MLFNIIVLFYEVLYYSLFMKFARKEGKLWRYIVLYALISLLFSVIGTKAFYSYLLLVLIMLLGFKYIVKTKTSMFDLLIIIAMLFIKLGIELVIYMLFFHLLKCSHFIVTMLFELIKIMVVLLLNTNLNKFYLKLKTLWDNNNFYIRYITSVLLYAYVIITIGLKIIMPFVK